MPLHLLKLCVGVESVEQLELVWAGRGARAMHTRQSPRRAAELTDGGSLYWVMRGTVACRQPILAVRTVEEGARCEVDLGLPVVRVEPQARRPFQGWRYLTSADAPPDLGELSDSEALPAEFASRLRAIGAW